MAREFNKLMVTTRLIFKTGEAAKFHTYWPEFFNERGIDYVGIGTRGDDLVAVYLQDELTKVEVEFSSNNSSSSS